MKKGVSYNYIKGDIEVHYNSSDGSEPISRSSSDVQTSSSIPEQEFRIKIELEKVRKAIKADEEQIKILENHPKLQELDEAQKTLKSLEEAKRQEDTRIEKAIKKWSKKTKEMRKQEQSIIGDLEQEKKRLKAQMASHDSKWSDKEIRELTESKEKVLKELNQELDEEGKLNQEIDQSLKVERRNLIQTERQVQQDLIRWKQQREQCEKQDEQQIEKVRQESKRWLKDIKGLKSDLEIKVMDLKNKIQDEREKSAKEWTRSETEGTKHLKELTNSILDGRLIQIRQRSQLQGEMAYLEGSKKAFEDLALEIPMTSERESNQFTEVSENLLEKARGAVQQLEERKMKLLAELEEINADTEDQKAEVKREHDGVIDQLQGELQQGLDTIPKLEANKAKFDQMRRDRDEIRDQLRLIAAKVDELKANHTRLKYDRQTKAKDLLDKTKSALDKVQQAELNHFKNAKAQMEQLRSKKIRKMCRIWENKSGSDFVTKQDQILEQMTQELKQELQTSASKDRQTRFDPTLKVKLQGIKDLDLDLVGIEKQMASLTEQSKELLDKWTEMKHEADKELQNWEENQTGDPIQPEDNQSQSESQANSDDSSGEPSVNPGCCCWKC
ncbi:hypothetical protein TCAL_17113 [Tigriopus californicus]|uniref:Uncharacterized protein n=1 Tax=Tigriopus californicus TaxID=6832 RepID=A0A553P4T2_TIGCA|nr:trichohyalin-like [Tigriopus californicus]TRY72685.1 hypothetical protein TCAL_17113 [Tigriopus californicus]